MGRNTDYQIINSILLLIATLFLSAAIIINTFKISSVRERVELLEDSYNNISNSTYNDNNINS